MGKGFKYQGDMHFPMVIGGKENDIVFGNLSVRVVNGIFSTTRDLENYEVFFLRNGDKSDIYGYIKMIDALRDDSNLRNVHEKLQNRGVEVPQFEYFRERIVQRLESIRLEFLKRK